ncbi:MAG TPA: ferredoxin reductase family protein [Acidimicrobiales bacterium]|nr:ferredoxin reductase family protein [Acidimicrobiales bacterium]
MLGQAAVAGGVLGLLAVVLLGVASESGADLHVRGGVAMFVGGMTGLVGMYLALVQLLLISRIPQLERILGQDGLLRWHRRVGPWPISLLVVHAVVITIGFAQAAKSGVLHELAVFLRSYPDMLAATVGLALMVAAGVASIGALRRRMRRETWWVLHLYMYLALALSFAHVLALGPTFVGHPATQAVWALVWALTAGTVLLYRFGLPIARSIRYQIRVSEVHREAPGVVSIVCTGRQLHRLRISGGQFFAWRFLARGLWWQAHPYTVSALPRPPHLRLTVRQLGDHSSAIARLRPGTRVAIEGPYGAVTPDVRMHDKVVLVAGGIGITAIRALLEDLPKTAQPIVVMRAPTTEQLVLRDETAALVRKLNGTLHELVGPRSSTGSPRAFLRRLVPDLSERDLYVCGPEGFVHEVIAAAHELGVHRNCVHYEVYQW